MRRCPASRAGSDAKLDEKAYDRLKAQADAFLASLQPVGRRVRARSIPTIQEMLADLAFEAAGPGRPRRQTWPARVCRPAPSRRPRRPRPWPTPPRCRARPCRSC